MKNTFATFFAAEENLNTLDERISETFNNLFANLKYSFGHAGEKSKGLINRYLELQGKFGHTGILHE